MQLSDSVRQISEVVKNSIMAIQGKERILPDKCIVSDISSVHTNRHLGTNSDQHNSFENVALKRLYKYLERRYFNTLRTRKKKH